MKVRIKFSKYGEMKYIGHLDVMRYFQKAIRRAQIDIAYSEGMSPHMIMSFASPLGVGLTSSGEYMDIEVRTPLSSEEMRERLNAVMVEGVSIQDCREVPQGKASNAMSLVAAADYEIVRNITREGNVWPDFLDEFLKQESIPVTKKTKKGERTLDIRPLIYSYSIDGEKLSVMVSAGSEENLRPELIMSACMEYRGLAYDPFAFLIHRKELYARADEQSGQKFVTLNDLGTPIILS